MIPMKELPVWEPGEEKANTITHAIGCVLSIGIIIAIIVQQVKTPNTAKFAGMMIFGLSSVLLYFVSTFYHGLKNLKWKKIFRYGDHCSIFFLIAGSYAPFCLTTLRNDNGLVVLIVIWAIAFIGVFLKVMWFDIFDKVTLIYYIVMGWVVVMTLGTLIKNLPAPGLYYIFMCGVLYTLGTIFYARDEDIPYAHAIWHLFVLGGTIETFISTYFYC